MAFKWMVSDSDDNAASTALRAAQTGKKHIVYGISVSYSVAKTLKVILKNGSDTIATFHVYNQRDIIFPQGIEMTPGNACSAVLDASGTGGTIGSVVMHGETPGAVA